MKIFVFANDKEWTEYNYEDFDRFFLRHSTAGVRVQIW